MPRFGRKLSDAPGDRFLRPEDADANGIVRSGGKLDVDWLLEAYGSGIFPWPYETTDWLGRRRFELAWFSPDPRGVLPLDGLRVPDRLARRIRRGEFEIRFDTAFDDVIDACATIERPGALGVWLTPAMVAAYKDLHRAGHAHSVEAFSGGRLVGGLYGVATGGCFSGESMFRRVRDASKAVVVALVERLRERGFALFDIQQATPPMIAMGAKAMPRDEFLSLLRTAAELSPRF